MIGMHSLCQLNVADLSYSDVVQGVLRASGMKMPYMFVVPQRAGSTQSKAPALLRLQISRQAPCVCCVRALIAV